jgi:hypothetical protein
LTALIEPINKHDQKEKLVDLIQRVGLSVRRKIHETRELAT